MSDEIIKCSFCGSSDEDGELNMIRSNTDQNVFICENCIKNTHLALENYEKQKREESIFENPEVLTPEEIKEYLDQYVIGQNKAKEIYEILYIDKTEKFRELWKEKDIEILFEEKVNPFITNILLLLGLEYHKENIKK